MFLTPDPLFSNGVIPIDSVGGAGENWFWCGLNREQVSLAPNGEVILVCSIPESIRYFAVWLSDSHGAAPRSAAKHRQCIADIHYTCQVDIIHQEKQLVYLLAGCIAAHFLVV